MSNQMKATFGLIRLYSKGECLRDRNLRGLGEKAFYCLEVEAPLFKNPAHQFQWLTVAFVCFIHGKQLLKQTNKHGYRWDKKSNTHECSHCTSTRTELHKAVVTYVPVLTPCSLSSCDL